MSAAAAVPARNTAGSTASGVLGAGLSHADRCRLVVVGDVHDAWSNRDAACLGHLEPSMVLFVGDFGNEAVQLVAEVANLPQPKAVILGNHDAWFTMTGGRVRKRPWVWGKSELLSGLTALAQQQQGQGQGLGPQEVQQGQQQEGELQGQGQRQEEQAQSDGECVSASDGAPSLSSMDSSIDEADGREPDSDAESGTSAGASSSSSSSSGGGGGGGSSSGDVAGDASSGSGIPGERFAAVEAQLQLLGSSHVGFSSLPVPGHDVAIVGARPFSKGGDLQSVAPFYEHLFGASTSEQFTQRIVAAGLQASQGGRELVLLAHNGPSGLGEKPHNPCGVDWREGGGDHGDRDLQEAIEQLRAAGANPALVAFGHMHHVLFGRKGKRQMVHVDEHGTVYLNAATVPRVRTPTPVAPARAAVNGRRVKMTKAKREQSKSSSRSAVVAAALQGQLPTQHHFLVVDMVQGAVEVAKDVWVQVQPMSATSAQPPADQGGSNDGQGDVVNAADSTAASSLHREAGQGVPEPAPGAVGAGAAEGQYAVRVAQESEVYCRQAGEQLSTHRYLDASTGRYITSHAVSKLEQAAAA